MQILNRPALYSIGNRPHDFNFIRPPRVERRLRVSLCWDRVGTQVEFYGKCYATPRQLIINDWRRLHAGLCRLARRGHLASGDFSGDATPQVCKLLLKYTTDSRSHAGSGQITVYDMERLVGRRTYRAVNRRMYPKEPEQLLHELEYFVERKKRKATFGHLEIDVSKLTAEGRSQTYIKFHILYHVLLKASGQISKLVKAAWDLFTRM